MKTLFIFLIMSLPLYIAFSLGKRMGTTETIIVDRFIKFPCASPPPPLDKPGDNTVDLRDLIAGVMDAN